MRGQSFSSDSDDRWRSLLAVAKELGIEIRPELTIQLERDLTSPELGYPVVQELLQNRRAFTAIVSFNDIAAIGAIRALRDANLGVPEDVSVIGFDDIQVAAYHNPRLTELPSVSHCVTWEKLLHASCCNAFKASKTIPLNSRCLRN
jgi:LacI family transcriptional regulator